MATHAADNITTEVSLASVPEVARALGAIIHSHRTKNDLSQNRLAALSGINNCYISQIERGISMPTVYTMLKLALALNTTVARLLIEAEKVLRQGPAQANWLASRYYLRSHARGVEPSLGLADAEDKSN